MICSNHHHQSNLFQSKPIHFQQSIDFQDPNATALVPSVSTKVPITYRPNSNTQPIARILAIDCGCKYNIIRWLVSKCGMEVVLLPYDFDLEGVEQSGQDWVGSNWKGLFLSNGPGDPTMCGKAISTIQYVMKTYPERPIFGICLGNQLLALAAGAKTYKMRYGNRGMNQPAIDLRTGRCYITPQNHGYAIDTPSLKACNFHPLFLNANDHTNEGIIHNIYPWFSCQFHPEAMGGPEDTGFLFDYFKSLVVNDGLGVGRSLLSVEGFANRRYKKVLLIGSGGLSIGQVSRVEQRKHTV